MARRSKMTRKTGHKGSKKAHKGRRGTRKGRAASPWNLLVKKVFNEGRKSNKAYTFSQALKDASRRKGEMKE
jgi:hypothetical protein